MSTTDQKAEARRLASGPVVDPISTKRAFDLTLAVLALIWLWPCFLLIAVAIKLDSQGPVFFRQPRIGLNNHIFKIWKFRTMLAERADIMGGQLTRRNDSRVTRVGGWLRKWSLDELPQVLNVLAGEMSVVGPRPHPLQAKAGETLYHDVVAGYQKRHEVLPGITGWAQVNGWRGETSEAFQIEQRVRYDLEYIARQSIWFDLRILLLTCACVVRNQAF
jgi:lipopolysaccharide/colanic/teichoic acid biosynthesis glycosyltransferase